MTGDGMARDVRGDPALVEMAIIERSRSGVRKLPMLDVIFPDVANDLPAALKGAMGVLAEVSYGGMRYAGWSEALTGLPENDICVAATVTPGEGQIILSLGAEMFYAIYEGRLNSGDRRQGVPDRGPSSGEKRVARRLTQVVLDVIASTISRVMTLHFATEAVETPRQALSLRGSAFPAVIVTLNVLACGASGDISVLIPMDAFGPERERLEKVFLGENVKSDDAWSEALSDSLGSAHVDIQAVYRSFDASLSEIVDWMPGMIIPLGPDDDREMTVTCEGVRIFSVQSGKKDGRIAISVVDGHDGEGE